MKDINEIISEDTNECIENYNNALEELSSQILSLRIASHYDIDVQNLLKTKSKLSIINSKKIRRDIDDKLYAVYNQYSTDLENAVKGEL